MASDQPSIRAVTREAVLAAPLPDDLRQAFYRLTTRDDTWTGYPNGTRPLDPVVLRAVINHLFLITPSRQPYTELPVIPNDPHDSAQIALIYLVGDVGFQLGYRLEALSLRYEDAEDSEDREMRSQFARNNTMPRYTTRGTQPTLTEDDQPSAIQPSPFLPQPNLPPTATPSLRSVLASLPSNVPTSTLPRNTALVMSSKAPNGYKFHCVVPGCRQQTAVGGLSSLKQHLKKEHSFSNESVDDVFYKEDDESKRLMRAFGPFDQDALIKMLGRSRGIKRTKKEIAAETRRGSGVSKSDPTEIASDDDDDETPSAKKRKRNETTGRFARKQSEVSVNSDDDENTSEHDFTPADTIQTPSRRPFNVTTDAGLTFVPVYPTRGTARTTSARQDSGARAAEAQDDTIVVAGRAVEAMANPTNRSAKKKKDKSVGEDDDSELSWHEDTP